MQNKIHVGAFYTEGTPYKDVLDEFLLPSCKQFDIPVHIQETFNYGSWVRNVAEKPKVISSMLNFTYSNEVLIFLDADSRIMKYPVLFEEVAEDYDLGFHRLDWNSWYGYNQTPAKKELLTGTMFFRNNAKVKALCEEWYSIASNSSRWEQQVLEEILPKYDLKILELPIEYCYIYSRPGGLEPLVKCDPVIVHYQKSRELKRVVNGKT